MNQTHARAPFVIAATTVLLTVCLAFGDDVSRWAARFPAEIFVFRSSCANNLKQIGLAFKWHANENSGKFPQLSPEPGKLMFKWDDVYPQYLKDKEIMICPGKDESEQFDVFDDRDYIYWGYLITNDEDATLFVDAYNAQIEAGGEFPNFLMSPSSYGSYFARMSENVGRYLITDINNPPDGIPTDSEVPAMMEWPNNHQPHWGGNVLYVDGHIEWVPYGTFPMTDTMIGAMTEIAGMQPVTAYAQLDPVYFGNDPNGYTRDCANQHKQFGLSLKMYAGEHNGNFPPLNPEAGRLTTLLEAIYPEYLTGLDILTCPGAVLPVEHDEFDDHHYVYPGYLLTNDDDAELFVNAYAAEIAAAGDFTGPLPTPSTYGDEFLPFRENMQQFLTQEVNEPSDDLLSDRTTPVLIEWPGNHEGQMGGHVLYLDGHVEWIPYPGKFPMTERTIAALDAIADWTPTTEWMPPHPAYTLENDPYHFNRQCKSRIRSLYLAAVSYAFQTPNWPQSYPDLPTEMGRLMFAADDMFPQSLADPYLMVCPGPVPPSPPEHFDDQHYHLPRLRAHRRRRCGSLCDRVRRTACSRRRLHRRS